VGEISYGAKADSLMHLRDAGFNVPKFYLLDGKIKKGLDNPAAARRLRRRYENWVAENNISSVAVRSSSTLEDSHDSSFAGQFKTVLDVNNGDDFIRALNTVITSKQSIAYSNKAGSVNVIVQEFIEPDSAGIIFSVNPSNGNNELVINAAHGRGSDVVEGKSSHQYLVSRFDYSYEDTSSGVLTKSHIKALSSLAIDIETLFGAPQDIEWAIKDKSIYILQARPITRINHLRLWDSSNIAESFPGIVLPLTFSIAKRGYMYGYKSQAHEAGLDWYELERHSRMFDSMVGIFNGRMYYNLLSWYRFISLFPGSKRNQKFLDAQIATQGESIYQRTPKLSIWFRLRFCFRVIYRALFFGLELNRFYKRFKAFDERLTRLPKGGDTQTLMEKYTHIETIVPHFGRTVDNDFFVMTYHGWLKKLLTKWLPEDYFERNTIIGSIKGVLSSEQALSLYEIARCIKSDGKALDLLHNNNFEALDKYLHGSQIQKDIEHYITTFGHRFAEDQKIESINPTLEQFGMYRLIKVYVQLDDNEIKTRLGQSEKLSRRMEKLTETKLKLYQKFVYKILLKRLKHHLRIREKNRLLRGRVYGYLRALFPVIGDALVKDGVLYKREDIYYLQIEEIYQLLDGALIVNDLKGRIKQRRAAYKNFTDIRMPERFITTALPSLEKITSAAINTPAKPANKIEGLISSPGTIEGKAIVLEKPEVPDEPFDILVASHTDPGWTPLIALAKGVVVEHGGMLSHAAIITRELGIPSIIGTKDATSIIKTGMRVRINTQTSSVDILGSE
jgi:phosphohistidine swiveling domain-containing protein